VPAEQPSPIDPLRFGDLTFCAVSLEVRRNVPLERLWDYAWPGTPATLLSLATFGVAYAARPVGALVLGHRVVDVEVQRLRAKIGRERVETVRGSGYRLRA
jgi:hypothetical protein